MDIPLLTERDIESAIEHLIDWSLVDSSIVRTIDFPTFGSAIDFVTRVAELAEHADHHPDIDIRWRTVKLALTTHSAGVEPAGTTQKSGGLTKKDVDLARRIDALLAQD